MRAAAIVLLAVAGLLPRQARAVVGALAGGFLLRSVWTSGFDQGGSRAWLAVVGVLVAGAAAMVLGDAVTEPGGWRWVVLAGSVAAAYSCVPETDQFREVALVMLAAVAVEAFGLTRVPPPAFLAAWGYVAWATLYGATGRPSAIVGGLVALLPPLVAAAVSARKGGWAGVVVGGVWVVAAVVVARTGGIATTLRPALVAAGVGVAVAAAISAMLWRHWPTAPAAG